MFDGELLPSMVEVQHCAVHKSPFKLPVRFRSSSHNSLNRDGTVARQYQVLIETENGKVLYDTGLIQFPSRAIKMARQRLSPMCLHHTLSDSFHGNAMKCKGNFARSSATVQMQI